MSTVDDKIVNLHLNNGQFQKGIGDTLGAIGKLKQGLNFSKEKGALNEVSNEAKKFNLNSLLDATDGVSAKFVAMSTMAITALSNITNRAVDAGINLAKAFTIDPIKTGFQEYETQLNSVQTILANTSAKGTTLDQVNASLKELNTYADDTIYNFTEMTRNIGTFTAAGVDLDTSTAAIKGIANLAAVSGSNSQQASTAMYQLSQAMASGTVKLQDWNSVVNAGMGGEVFQKALKDTAKAQGIAVDDMIKKNGSFRESLKEGWITTDIMTKTLSKFTGDVTDAELKSQGYTKSQIKEIQEMAAMAKSAATESKTFTQAMDSIKEAVGSGWAESWQTITGDFNEAKKMWTGFSTTLGNVVGAQADARNKLLADWKELGGRASLIESVKNIWQALGNVIGPLKNAFQNIFPPATGKQLADITAKFEAFTKKLIPTSGTMYKLQMIFRGVFAAIDIVRMVVVEAGKMFFNLFKTVSGGTSSLMDLLTSFGIWLFTVRQSIKEGDGLSNIFKKLGAALKVPVQWVTNLVTSLIQFVNTGATQYLSKITTGFGKTSGEASKLSIALDWIKEKFAAIPGMMSDGIDRMVNRFKTLGSTIAEVGGSITPETMMAGLSGGAIIAVFVGIGKTIKNALSGVNSVMDSFKHSVGAVFGEGGMVDSISGSFGALTGTLEAMQTNVKAGTLMKIAIAVGILAASVAVLSMIDAAALAKALAAITVMFVQLGASLLMFDKAASSKVTAKLPILALGFIGLGIAINLLALALKTISSLSWQEIAKGLAGVTGLLMALSLATKAMSTDSKRMISTGIGLMAVAVALKILASTMKTFAALEWEELAKGGAAIGALLGILGVFTRLAGSAKGMISTGAGLILVSVALKMLVGVISSMAEMNWTQLGTGIGGIALTLVALAGAMHLMPKNMIVTAAALIIVAQALSTLVTVIQGLAGMSMEQLAIGIGAMGVSLAVIAGAMALMTGAIPGAIALTMVTVALGLFLPILITLGSLPIETIAIALGTLAAMFAVLGLAALALAPVVLPLMLLAAAVALLGVATLAAGAGMMAFGLGFGMIASAVASGGLAIIGMLKAVIALIPFVAENIAKGIISMAKTLATGGAEFTAAITTLLTSLLDSVSTILPKLLDIVFNLLSQLIEGALDLINTYLPQIIDTVLNGIQALIEGIMGRIPEIATAGANMIIALLDGVAEKIPQIADKAVELITNFLNAIADSAVKLADAGMKMIVDFINGLADSIRNNTAAMESAMRNLGDAAIQAIRTIFLGGFDIGSELVNGMTRGIRNGINSVTEAAKGVARSALDGAKRLLGIASPSKEFIKVGKFVNDGFIKGLKSGNYKNVQKVFTDLKADLKSLKESAKKDSEAAAKQLARLNKARKKDYKAINKAAAAKKQADKEYAAAAKAIEKIDNASLSRYNKLKAAQAAAKKESAAAAKKLKELNKAKKKDQKAIAKAAAKKKKADKEYSEATKSLSKMDMKAVKQREKLNNKTKEYEKTLKKLAKAEDDLAAKKDERKQYKDSITEQYSGLPDFLANETITKRVDEASTKYDELAEKVYTAADALQAANDEMANSAQQIKDQFNKLPEIEDETTVEDYIAKLKSDAEALAKFNTDIFTLRSMGLDTDTFNDLMARGISAQPFIDKLLEMGPEALTEIDQLNSALYEQAKNLGDRVSQELHQANVDAAKKELDLLSGQLEEEAKKVEAAGKDVVGAYIEDLKKQKEATEKFNADMKKLREMGLNDDLYKEFMEKGLDSQPFIDELLKGGKSQVDAMNKAQSGLHKAAADLGKSSSGALYDAGVNVAQGLVNGLKDEKAGLKKAMDEIALSMVTTIKKALGIKSPSRVFMGIGKYTGEGLIKGMDGMSKSIDKTAGSMGEGAISGIKKALSNIDAQLPNVLDMNPRITPVLNLDDVRKRAGELTKMLPSNTLDINASSRAAYAASNEIATNKRLKADLDARVNIPRDSINFIQNNTSPKAISTAEVYRNTKNLISKVKEAVDA